jgi:hypothetical protein
VTETAEVKTAQEPSPEIDWSLWTDPRPQHHDVTVNLWNGQTFSHTAARGVHAGGGFLVVHSGEGPEAGTVEDDGQRVIYYYPADSMRDARVNVHRGPVPLDRPTHDPEGDGWQCRTCERPRSHPVHGKASSPVDPFMPF